MLLKMSCGFFEGGDPLSREGRGGRARKMGQSVIKPGTRHTGSSGDPSRDPLVWGSLGRASHGFTTRFSPADGICSPGQGRGLGLGPTETRYGQSLRETVLYQRLDVTN